MEGINRQRNLLFLFITGAILFLSLSSVNGSRCSPGYIAAGKGDFPAPPNYFETLFSLVELASTYDPDFWMNSNKNNTSEEQEPFTIFAPTNRAFLEVFAAIGTTLETALQTPVEAASLFNSILRYHILPQVVMTSDLYDGQILQTFAPDESTLSVKNAEDPNSTNIGVLHQLNPFASFNDVKFMGEVDLRDSCGNIIHPIDNLMFPSSDDITASPSALYICQQRYEYGHAGVGNKTFSDPIVIGAPCDISLIENVTVEDEFTMDGFAGNVKNTVFKSSVAAGEGIFGGLDNVTFEGDTALDTVVCCKGTITFEGPTIFSDNATLIVVDSRQEGYTASFENSVHLGNNMQFGVEFESAQLYNQAAVPEDYFAHGKIVFKNTSSLTCGENFGINDFGFNLDKTTLEQDLKNHVFTFEPGATIDQNCPSWLTS